MPVQVPDAFSNGVSYAQLTAEMNALLHSLHALLGELSHSSLGIAQEVRWGVAGLVHCCTPTREASAGTSHPVHDSARMVLP